jgi:FlaA1/EpsC-like NDP-sugar epimerase
MTASAILGLFALFIIEHEVLPRSIIIIDFLLTVALIGGVRFAYRSFAESFRSSNGDTHIRRRRVLVLGAGLTGEMLVREMTTDRSSTLKPVGFLDDNDHKTGSMLCGVPILGKIDALVETAARLRAELIIIAISSLVGEALRRIIDLCNDARTTLGIDYRIIHRSLAGIDDGVSVSQIREVNAEDLLRRAPVEIDHKNIERHLLKKCVLITGAAGSIGSELARQVFIYYPRRMIMIDRSENDMFYLQQELAARKTNTGLHYVVGDIRDANKMERLFAQYRPDVVFHAAANKHVPLMESNAEEAVLNNVVSTQTIIGLSSRYAVQRFVMLSTDKAVNPSSIMGASKRIAELLVQAQAGKSKTVFTTVRFGNVIGSRASLVPVLLRQIQAGGPVTVTHRDIERYFMTIPEAVRLVTQAMAMAEGNDVFVLDMGKAVKIAELAEDLIRLAGYAPHEQIPIVYTGLRPGEKMYEELWADRENIIPTDCPGIMRAVRNNGVNGRIDHQVADLLKSARAYNRADLVKKIKVLVPEAGLGQ